VTSAGACAQGGTAGGPAVKAVCGARGSSVWQRGVRRSDRGSRARLGVRTVTYGGAACAVIQERGSAARRGTTLRFGTISILSATV
jgi:hypothetical protein